MHSIHIQSNILSNLLSSVSRSSSVLYITSQLGIGTQQN